MKLLTAVLALVAVCVMASPPQEDNQQWEARKAVSRGNLDFTMDLFKVISKKPGNLFFSPTSIHVILAMTSLGARGETAQEMVRGLHLPSDQQKVKDGFRSLMTSLQSKYGGTSKIVNRIFTDSRFTPTREFVQTATHDFHSGSESVNFRQKYDEARAHINSWVSEQTESKIRDLLPAGSVDTTTMVVLVNALYFKGMWSTKFEKQSTTPQPFHVTSGFSKTVPMMYQVASRIFGYTDSERLNAEILDMYYLSSDIKMMIILPKDKNGLQDVEARLSQMTLSDLMKREVSRPKVNLYLPKFTIEHPEDLNNVLAELGMTKMFAPEADFKGLVGNNQTIKISRVVHKAFIKVDEDGTEAAAATAGGAGGMSGFFGPPPPEITFKADHPFLFLLVKDEFNIESNERDYSVLFMGRCAEPSG